MKIIFFVKYFFNIYRIIPVSIIILSHKNDVIKKDIARWSSVLSVKHRFLYNLFYFMFYYKEYRSLLLYRLNNYRISHKIVSIFFPPIDSLQIMAKSIGGGFFIQHGIATIIYADSIGDNFFVNQQVTIGSNRGGIPTIGNNVTIRSGAIVVGKIKIGDNVIVGANTFVNKNIPSNSTVHSITKLNICSNDN